MNRHVPHSAIAGDPDTHKPCSGCGGHVQLQPDPVEHVCAPECSPQQHVTAHEARPPLVRYFTDDFDEVCADCVARHYGVNAVVVGTDQV